MKTERDENTDEHREGDGARCDSAARSSDVWTGENEDMDEGSEGSEGSASPPPAKPRSRGRVPPIKLGVGVDRKLIASVRERPVLYDPAHARYMDIKLKNHIWKKIGKELKANPSACKSRWYNIRDNYRKSLRKRFLTGQNSYKFGSLLTFLEPYYKGQPEATPLKPRKPKPKPKPKESEDSEEDDDDAVDTKQQIQEVTSIKADMGEEEQSESVIEYTVMNKSVSDQAQAQAVDAFLAALAPPLKELSPYHLSLAKAEIYATVHKYELKGIVEGTWPPKSLNPLQ